MKTERPEHNAFQIYPFFQVTVIGGPCYTSVYAFQRRHHPHKSFGIVRPVLRVVSPNRLLQNLILLCTIIFGKHPAFPTHPLILWLSWLWIIHFQTSPNLQNPEATWSYLSGGWLLSPRADRLHGLSSSRGDFWKQTLGKKTWCNSLCLTTSYVLRCLEYEESPASLEMYKFYWLDIMVHSIGRPTTHCQWTQKLSKQTVVVLLLLLLLLHLPLLVVFFFFFLFVIFLILILVVAIVVDCWFVCLFAPCLLCVFHCCSTTCASKYAQCKHSIATQNQKNQKTNTNQCVQDQKTTCSIQQISISLWIIINLYQTKDAECINIKDHFFASRHSNPISNHTAAASHYPNPHRKPVIRQTSLLFPARVKGWQGGLMTQRSAVKA